MVGSEIKKIEEAGIEEQAAEGAGDLKVQPNFAMACSCRPERADRANKEIAELQKEQRFSRGSG